MRPGATFAKGRTGFTFTEILFAVMILGIGLIMVAAMFPVAIRQTEETLQEATAASTARSGASYMERIATQTTMPVTGGKMVAFGGAPDFWTQVAGDLVLSTDNRFAWVPFYGRATDPVTGLASPYAQITIIAVESQNQSNFTIGDATRVAGAAGTANLEGRSVIASFTHTAGIGADTVVLTQVTAPWSESSLAGANVYEGAGEGTYLIVGDDGQTANPGKCNGNVYRLGNESLPRPSPTSRKFELAVGNDMHNTRYQPTGGQVLCWFVGRSYTPGSGNTTFSGPVMDVAAFSTFVRVQ